MVRERICTMKDLTPEYRLSPNDPLFLNRTERFIVRTNGVGLIPAMGLKWFGRARITQIGEK